VLDATKLDKKKACGKRRPHLRLTFARYDRAFLTDTNLRRNHGRLALNRDLPTSRNRGVACSRIPDVVGPDTQEDGAGLVAEDQRLISCPEDAASTEFVVLRTKG
jgi:hypothetical protein